MAPPRPSSPAGSVSTAKSARSSVAHSPRPVLPVRKSYRRGSNTAGKLVSAVGSLTRSASNSSITRSIGGNSNANHAAMLPPQLSESENASLSNSSTPLPTPPNNNANPSFLFDETTPSAGSSSSRGKTIPNNSVRPDPQNPDHRRSLPRPPPPSRCPLLCVFYAEFDIVVGPKVCFQSPQKFMHFDVDVSDEDVHHALEETFQAVIPNENEKRPAFAGDNRNKKGCKQLHGKGSEISPPIIGQQDPDEYWNWTPNKKGTVIDHENLDVSSQTTLPSSGHKGITFNTSGSASGTEGSGKLSHDRKKHCAPNESTNNATNTTTQSTHSRNPSFASSSKGTTSNPLLFEGDTSTIDTELLQNSIFAATSEYIITGNELANQTITVSTHGMHILSRPMIIRDTQRYERNSLLFAVGFVLRRNVDPRPYWPVLSKLSSTFSAMETESEFLSHHRTRPQVQIVLEDILVSLNSKQKDCHLVLDDANTLNLRLFRPPPPPTPPVPDHAVPILLRPEWQLQMYDWDLTINWIVPHIDGCKYVKQIAVSSEVDMEMVRACLRVLRHHGVLAYVDVFRYCNIYEFTPLALGLLTGTDKKADEIKDAAFWYAAKSKHVRQAQRMLRASGSNRNSPSYSPSSSAARRLHPHLSSLHSLDLSVPSSTTPLASAIAAEITRRQSMTEDLPRSFPSRAEHITIREEDEDEPPVNTDKGTMGHWSNSSHLKQIIMMKEALAQIYSSCNRNQSFGEMLLSKFENKTPSTSEDHVNETTVAKNVAADTRTTLREASGSKGDKAADDMNIDWEMAFDYFDHRRLVTFGVIRGLIRRVHQYPLAYEVGTGADDVTISGNGRDASSRDPSSHGTFDEESDDFISVEMTPDPYHSTPMEISMTAEVAATAAKTALDERSRTPSFSASPLPHSFPTPPLKGRDETLRNNLNRKEEQLRSKKLLLERMASAMDGTRCDDELSCMFEIPIEKLIEMPKDAGRWNVISVFSCTK